MPILSSFKRKCTTWAWLLLTLLVIAILLRLGFWQVSRGHEKQAMLNQKKQSTLQDSTLWSPALPLPQQYEALEVKGVYIDKALLLDNQIYHQKVGFDVLSPLLLENNQVVLVDRGWIFSERDRVETLNIDTPKGEQIVKGYAYYPSSKGFKLGEIFDKETKTLAVIEWVDEKKIAHFLQYSVYPFIIRLDEREPNGFVRKWPIVSLAPERHYAYAVQWFAMALIVAIIYIALNLKRKHAKQKK